MSNLTTPQLLLASGSPRRKELLSRAGLSFTIVSPNIDETALKKETPKAMVQRLSYLKGHEAAKSTSGDVLIIAADTTVVSQRGKILGKPKDEKDALKILKSIVGKTHSVFTGFTIIHSIDGKIMKTSTRIVETKVKMRKVNQKAILYYLSLGESWDKAGAYAAQGYGMNLIESLTGSYTNVVGLPMCELIEELKKRFKYPCPL